MRVCEWVHALLPLKSPPPLAARLPIEEPYLDAESGVGESSTEDLPLMRAKNPLMATLAFLAQAIGPRVAAVGAKAALRELTRDTPLPASAIRAADEAAAAAAAAAAATAATATAAATAAGAATTTGTDAAPAGSGVSATPAGSGVPAVVPANATPTAATTVAAESVSAGSGSCSEKMDTSVDVLSPKVPAAESGTGASMAGTDAAGITAAAVVLAADATSAAPASTPTSTSTAMDTGEASTGGVYTEHTQARLGWGLCTP